MHELFFGCPPKQGKLDVRTRCFLIAHRNPRAPINPMECGQFYEAIQSFSYTPWKWKWMAWPWGPGDHQFLKKETGGFPVVADSLFTCPICSSHRKQRHVLPSSRRKTQRHVSSSSHSSHVSRRSMTLPAHLPSTRSYEKEHPSLTSWVGNGPCFKHRVGDSHEHMPGGRFPRVTIHLLDRPGYIVTWLCRCVLQQEDRETPVDRSIACVDRT